MGITLQENRWQDGDRLELGTAPDGSRDWHLKVVHTPGHAVDHLCFIDSRYHAAIVGDMLSTVSTIIIDPPEGHMGTYPAQPDQAAGNAGEDPVPGARPAAPRRYTA